MKPVSFDRFLKAINKARIQIDNQAQVSIGGTVEVPGYFFIKANNKLNKVLYNEVLYIQSIGDYIKVFTSQAPLVSYRSMKTIENKLPTAQFIRVHNSHIVSINAVKAVDGNSLELTNGVSLPIAKGRKEALFAALQIKDE